MPRIDRYILGQLLTLFGFFALVLVSVYWINRAVSLFDDLLNDGQTALVVLEFTALTLPLVISVVLPVAAFAATAYGTNRLAGESELVAMQSAGLGPWRLARPVLIFGVFVGVMVAVLVHGLVPMARDRAVPAPRHLPVPGARGHAVHPRRGGRRSPAGPVYRGFARSRRPGHLYRAGGAGGPERYRPGADPAGGHGAEPAPRPRRPGPVGDPFRRIQL